MRLMPAHAEGPIHIIPTPSAARGQPLGNGLKAFDLEADVMDAAELLPPFDAGRLVVLEVQDGQIDVAVAQETAPRAGIVDLRDLHHAENVLVESGRRL